MMIYLFPTEMEAQQFRLAAPDAEVVICGVGMAAAAATMARIAPRCINRKVVLAGIAGSYDTSLNPINQVVEVTSEQIEELPTRFAQRYEIPLRWGLPMASANSVNRSNAPHSTTQIENMEGAAVVAICQSCGITISEVRAISNRVGDPISEWQIKSAVEALTKTLLSLR